MAKYINPYTDLDRDITNAMNDAEEKDYGKGMEIGMEKGIAQGRAEGERAALIATARNLKSLDVPIDKIAAATHLPISEIQSL